MLTFITTVLKTLAELLWLQTLLRGLTQYSRVLSISSAITLAAFSALLDLNSLIRFCFDPNTTQRKTKIFTHTLGFSLNVIYGLGLVLKDFISNFGLGLVALACDCISLGRLGFIVYDTHQMIKNAHDKNNEKADTTLLTKLVEQQFRNKTALSYNLISVCASTLFVASLFVPPLMWAGLSILVTSKCLQFYDDYYDLYLSRGIANYWNGPVVMTEKKQNAELTLTQHNNPANFFVAQPEAVTVGPPATTLSSEFLRSNTLGENPSATFAEKNPLLPAQSDLTHSIAPYTLL